MVSKAVAGAFEGRTPAYLLAIALVGVCVVLRHWVGPALGGHVPYLFMLIPALVAARVGGTGPGCFAALLSCAAGMASRFPSSLGPVDSLKAVVFAVQSAIGVWLVTSLRRQAARANAAAERVARIHAVSSQLGKVGSIDEVTQTILCEAVGALEATAGAVFLLSGSAGPLQLVASLHAAAERGVVPAEISLKGDSPVARAVRLGEGVFPDAYTELGGSTRSRASWPALKVGASMCLPMTVAGQVVGVLTLTFSNWRAFDPQERFWALTLAQHCGMAIERARLLKAEQRARMDAEEASRAKEGFLNVASHELRGPLGSILGWTRLLRNTEPDPARLSHGLEVIERSARAQVRLVDDILDVSRIASGKLKIQARPLSLGKLVGSSVETARVAADARGIELSLVRAVDAVVLGDPDRLRQVVDNLLSNALKFTQPGGHVRLEMDSLDGKCVLRVCDDGKGIAADDIPYVFEVFHQADASSMRREGGLGLGLSIVKHIVLEHRGSVRIDSPGVGRGTTVTVELTMAPALTQLSGAG